MPFYEYECPSCKYYAEVLQKITDPGQNVLARIAMAQALLERPFDRLQTYGGKQRDPQLSK